MCTFVLLMDVMVNGVGGRPVRQYLDLPVHSNAWYERWRQS